MRSQLEAYRCDLVLSSTNDLTSTKGHHRLWRPMTSRGAKWFSSQSSKLRGKVKISRVAIPGKKMAGAKFLDNCVSDAITLSHEAPAAKGH